MTEIVHINKSKLMSQAVVHDGLVYLSGQIAWEHRDLGVVSQMQEILQNIDTLLSQAGTDKGKLLTVSIWLSDIADFSEMNEVWLDWIDSENPPARATVEAKLAFPEIKVEIQAVAAI